MKDPAIYFSTDGEPEGEFLQRLAKDRGMERRLGETNEQLRARLRRHLRSQSRGTVDSLRFALECSQYVSRVVSVGERFTDPTGPIVDVVLEWSPHQWQTPIDVEGGIRDIIRSELPLGAGFSIEFRAVP